MKVLSSVLKSLLLVALCIWFVRCSSEDEPRFEELSTEPGNIETIAGMGPDHFGYEGDGVLATTAKIGWITGIAVDKDGNIYITDGAANTVQKIDHSNGKINTIAGSFRGYNCRPNAICRRRWSGNRGAFEYASSGSGGLAGTGIHRRRGQSPDKKSSG